MAWWWPRFSLAERSGKRPGVLCVLSSFITSHASSGGVKHRPSVDGKHSGSTATTLQRNTNPAISAIFPALLRMRNGSSLAKPWLKPAPSTPKVTAWIAKKPTCSSRKQGEHTKRRRWQAKLLVAFRGILTFT
jgi:hypothetical protein